MTNKTMRTELEIQKAHDIIAVVIEEGAVIGSQLAAAYHCKSVLCWVLLHGSGQPFETLISTIEDAMRKRGFELHKPTDN